MNRFVCFTALVALGIGLPLATSAGCGAQVATVLAGDGGGDAPSSSSSSSGGGAACTSDPQCNANPAISSLHGSCINGACVCNRGFLPTADGRCGDVVGPVEDAAVDAPAFDGGTPTTPVCFDDKDCNDDPSVSALLGTCALGVCTCQQGYVQKSGKCGPTQPPVCSTQSGTCRQMPAQCNKGELGGDILTNMSCGDLIAAVCCFAETTCKGGAKKIPEKGFVVTDFVCCDKSGTASPPICVNGWKTCIANQTPTSNPGGGC